MATTSKGFPFPVATDPDKPRLDIEALAAFLERLPGVQTVTEVERDGMTDLWAGMVIFVTDYAQLQVNRTGVAGDWAAIIDTSLLPLPIAAGGTGRTVAPSMLVNVGSTFAQSPLLAAPRPGVTGQLGVGNGGTGAANAADARTNLGVLSAEEVGVPETDFVATFNAGLV